MNDYKSCFDFKNAEILFKHKNENFVVNLFSEIKLLYNLLYILFEIKLIVLKNYLLKNLILNDIREFIDRASALILFVFKKTIVFAFALIIET